MWRGGGCESFGGYLCGALPGYREVTNDEHREQVARIWGVPARRIQSKPALDAVQLFEGLETGQVKALWVVGCNPLATMPNAHHLRRALKHAELLVVQDCYHPTETSALAHVLLPAAPSFEVEGTMTNSERRISLAAYHQQRERTTHVGASGGVLIIFA